MLKIHEIVPRDIPKQYYFYYKVENTLPYMQLRTESGSRTTHLCPSPRVCAACTAAAIALPHEPPNITTKHKLVDNISTKKPDSKNIPLIVSNLTYLPQSSPSSLISRLAKVNASLSPTLYHLSTTLRSKTVGTKSQPIPSTYKKTDKMQHFIISFFSLFFFCMYGKCLIQAQQGFREHTCTTLT